MSRTQNILDSLQVEYPNSPEYHQAASEIAHQVADIVDANEQYKQHKVLERILRPEKIINFTIEWEDDNGDIQFNRGYRVQHSQILGPYKGGLRFHPSVNASILQFLALEQSIKNALTGEALGAGKGGANFNPKQHSKNEIRRFSRAFAEQLADHIGSDLDVPAGDIGVSSRELAWMAGKLQKIQHSFDASLTGKPPVLGGSEMREQATGYGTVFLLCNALESRGESLQNKRVVVSGAGNVAVHAAEQSLKKGATVLTLSNSRGCLHAESGLQQEHLDTLKSYKNEKNTLLTLAEQYGFEYMEKQKPWHVKADIYLPCATQNEVAPEDARAIAAQSNAVVAEGANMPCNSEAEDILKEHGILRLPGKAANAGGVIVSSFEIQQQVSRRYLTSDELEQRLEDKMRAIHNNCLQELSYTNASLLDYDIACTRMGFRRLADAMVLAGY